MYFCKHSCIFFSLSAGNGVTGCGFPLPICFSSHATSCQPSNFQPESCHTPASAKPSLRCMRMLFSFGRVTQLYRWRSPAARAGRSGTPARSCPHHVRGCPVPDRWTAPHPSRTPRAHECGARSVTMTNAVALADEIRKRSRRFADTARKRLSRRHLIFKRDGCISLCKARKSSKAILHRFLLPCE